MELRNFLIPAVVGLGLYAQSHDICLSNNTVALLELGLLLVHQEELHRHQCELNRLNRTVFDTPCCDDHRYATPFFAPFYERERECHGHRYGM